MKKVLVSIIAICFSSFVFSQTNFEPGYVVTNKADTVYGLVGRQYIENIYSLCLFKKGNDQEIISYSPTEVNGYGFFDNQFFESKKTTIPNQISQQFFLKVIVKGLVSLYRYKDVFLIEKDGEIHLLTTESKEEFVDGKMVLKSTNRHIGILNMLLYDCPDLKTRVSSGMRLSKRFLSNVIEDYNKCKGIPVIKEVKSNQATLLISEEKKPLAKGLIGVLGGLSFSKIKFTEIKSSPSSPPSSPPPPSNPIDDPVILPTPPYDEYLNIPFDLTLSPMVGISLGFLSPKISERVSFHSEFIYMSSSYMSYEESRYFQNKLINSVTIKLHQLKIPLNIRYTFDQRKIQPYINFGLTETIHLSSKSQWKQVWGGNVRYDQEALKIGDNQFGIWGGVGMVLSSTKKLNLSFEIRYEQTNGISDQPNWESKVSNLQVMVSLRFK